MKLYLSSVLVITLHFCVIELVESYSPICGKKCGENEICIGPNICACRTGYKRIATSFNPACGPICPECLNGICVSPGVCECMEGFVKKDGVCQAYCWMDCTNGFCVSENVCRCKQGFALSLPSLKCETVCTDCGHRACIGPDICECQYGYAWSIERKECLPTCTYCRPDLFCIAPEMCGCPPGHVLNTDVFTPTCVQTYWPIEEK